MKIWLDDIRPMPFPPRDGKDEYPFDRYAPYDLLCLTAEEVVPFLKEEKVRFISFDHDLGAGMDGYKLAKLIEKWAYMGKVKPIEYKVHSANPVGAQQIRQAMESAWKAWGDQGYVREV